jgi:tRNA dimethylallyltransferase
MSMNMKKKRQKILVIVGPTASGKSDLAVSLAKKFNGEIISADSRQVYRGMDIGTGKITKKEMKGIRHHLLDVADPKRRFDAEKYHILARAAIDDIISRDKLPIICGGTGFYIDAVLSNNPFTNVPPNLKLRKKLSTKSPAGLLLILKKLDPKRAKKISKSNSEKNNQRRIIRAIEIAYKGRAMHEAMHDFAKSATHEPCGDCAQSSAESSADSPWKNMPPQKDQYAPIFIGIKLDPVELKKRILSRLLKRLDHGMIKEARRLHRQGLSWKRMDELGLEYRYLARYLQKKMSKEEMVERLNTEIWHYARRQRLWWKRNKKIKWFDPANKKKILERVGDLFGK